MRIFQNERFLLLTIFFLALLVRLIYLSQISDLPSFYVLGKGLDMYKFDYVARQILKNGLWHSLSSFPPFYQYFIATIYRIFGPDYFFARFIQIILGSFTCIFIYLLGKKVFSNGVGIIACLLAIFYGPFLIYEGAILRASLSTFLSTLSALVLSSSSPYRKRDWFFSSILLGLASLPKKPEVFCLLFFIPLWLYIKRIPWKRVILLSGFFYLGLILFISPSLIKNLSRKNKITSSSAFSYAFLVGNTSNYMGAGYSPRTKVVKNTIERCQREDKDLFLETLRLIKERPLNYLKILGRKFRMYWNSYEAPGNINYHFLKKFSSLLKSSFSFGLIAPLGLLGIFLSFPFWRRVFLLYLFILINMGRALFLVVLSRHRLPMLPFLLIFAGFAIFWFYQRIKEKKCRRILFAFLALVLFVALVNSKHNYPLIRAGDYLNLGTDYLQTNSPERAAIAYQKALSIDPKIAICHNNLAVIYAYQKPPNIELARKHCRIALKLGYPVAPEFLKYLHEIDRKREK